MDGWVVWLIDTQCRLWQAVVVVVSRAGERAVVPVVNGLVEDEQVNAYIYIYIYNT